MERVKNHLVARSSFLLSDLACIGETLAWLQMHAEETALRLNRLFQILHPLSGLLGISRADESVELDDDRMHNAFFKPLHDVLF